MNGLLASLNREVGEFYGDPVEPRLHRAAKRRYAHFGKPRPQADPERDAHMVALRKAGHTLEEIGTSHGVTRERARQILERNGVTDKKNRRSTTLDPLAVLRYARSQEAHSLSGVAHFFDARTADVRRLFDALGVYPALRRLYRLRRRAIYLRQVAVFIEREGRLPYMGELGTETGVSRHPDLPNANTLCQVFGSMTAFWRALGVSPRRTGRLGHHSFAANTCRRGHEFTPENTYTWRDRRSCRTCMRMSQKRQR